MFGLTAGAHTPRALDSDSLPEAVQRAMYPLLARTGLGVESSPCPGTAWVRIAESQPSAQRGVWFSQTPKLLINWGLPFFLRFPCSPPLVALAAAFLAFFRQRPALQLEILALRHQLGVLQRSGGRLVKHARYYWLMLAESHLTRRLFGSMVRRIEALPAPTG